MSDIMYIKKLLKKEDSMNSRDSTNSRNIFAKFKKGQGYSIELIFFVIVCLILIYTLFSIYSILFNLNEDRNRNYIMEWSVSDILVKSRGISTDWEENGNISVLGLANEKNVIDSAKLSYLSSIPDENLSKFLRFEIYNVSIQILIDGNVYFQKGNISSNGTINQVDRVCVFANGTPCMLRIRYSISS